MKGMCKHFYFTTELMDACLHRRRLHWNLDICAIKEITLLRNHDFCHFGDFFGNALRGFFDKGRIPCFKVEGFDLMD